jgi:hypothetical protein
MQRLARAIHTAALPAPADESLEYYVEAQTADGATLRWPASAPEIGQTVVCVPASEEKPR